MYWDNIQDLFHPLFPPEILFLPQTHHLWNDFYVACGIPRMECGEEKIPPTPFD